MNELMWLIAAIIIGGTTIVIAMRCAYLSGQRCEELRGNRYLNSLSHLQRPDNQT